MSQFQNFISDFPTRCAELLDGYEEAVATGREVTLLLTVMAAGLAIPFARLRPQEQGGAVRDRAKYPDAQREFDSLLDSPFLTSDLCSGRQSWTFGEIANPGPEPEDWPELHQPRRLSQQKRTRAVLTHLRNAFAHGNILTTAGAKGISTIVFVARRSEDSADYNYLTVSPDDFLTFGRAWFHFLAQLPVHVDGLTLVADLGAA